MVHFAVEHKGRKFDANGNGNFSSTIGDWSFEASKMKEKHYRSIIKLYCFHAIHSQRAIYDLDITT